MLKFRISPRYADKQLTKVSRTIICVTDENDRDTYIILHHNTEDEVRNQRNFLIVQAIKDNIEWIANWNELDKLIARVSRARVILL